MRSALHGIAALLLILLSACGGGGSGNYGIAGSGGGTSANVQGTWQGAYTITGTSGTTAIYAAIAKGGYAFFYDTRGIIYVLPELTGSTTLSGNLTAFAPNGFTFADGKTVETFALTGTASDSLISGSFSGNGSTGKFTLTPSMPFSGNPSIVSGNWQGFYVGSGSPAAVALTMQSAGVFVGTDSNGCTLSGTLTQMTNENLFAVTVSSSGSSSLCVGKLTGLAYESSTDASKFFGGTTGTYYYLGVSNATSAFVAELKVQ